MNAIGGPSNSPTFLKAQIDNLQDGLIQTTQTNVDERTQMRGVAPMSSEANQLIAHNVVPNGYQTDAVFSQMGPRATAEWFSRFHPDLVNSDNRRVLYDAAYDGAYGPSPDPNAPAATQGVSPMMGRVMHVNSQQLAQSRGAVAGAAAGQAAAAANTPAPSYGGPASTAPAPTQPVPGSGMGVGGALAGQGASSQPSQSGSGAAAAPQEGSDKGQNSGGTPAPQAPQSGSGSDNSQPTGGGQTPVQPVGAQAAPSAVTPQPPAQAPQAQAQAPQQPSIASGFGSVGKAVANVLNDLTNTVSGAQGGGDASGQTPAVQTPYAPPMP
jgi:hypothetical protein